MTKTQSDCFYRVPIDKALKDKFPTIRAETITIAHQIDIAIRGILKEDYNFMMALPKTDNFGDSIEIANSFSWEMKELGKGLNAHCGEVFGKMYEELQEKLKEAGIKGGDDLRTVINYSCYEDECLYKGGRCGVFGYLEILKGDEK